MKMLLLLVVGLVNMVCCPQVAPAAVLVLPISGETALYAGIADSPESAVFTLVIDISAIDNDVRVPKVGGMTALMNGMPVQSVVVLSSILTSNAALTGVTGSQEYSLLTGQTRRFTLTTTVQTMQVGLIYASLRRITWRDLPSAITELNTVYFGTTMLNTPPAQISVPITTPDASTLSLLVVGMGVFATRRYRRGS